MKKRVILLILFFCFLLTKIIYASLLVEPSKVILKIDQQKQSGFITVINTGSFSLNLKAVLYDWDLDEKNNLVELPAKTKADSLAGLIKFNPREFILEPGRSQIVRYTISPPLDKLEHKGIIFIEHTSFVSTKGVVSADITSKVGSSFYVTTDNVKMALDFREISFFKENRTCLLKIAAANEGDGHIRLLAGYELQTKEGKTLAEKSFLEKLILPKKDFEEACPIFEDLPPGDYRLLLTLSYAGFNQIHKATLNFSVP